MFTTLLIEDQWPGQEVNSVRSQNKKKLNKQMQYWHWFKLFNDV